MFQMKTMATASAIGVVVAGGLALGTTHAVASTFPTPTCHEADLTITLEEVDGPQAGMSHSGKYLRMTNTSDGTCAVRGYPGLGLQSATGDRVHADVVRGSTYFAPDPGVKSVRLSPNESAWADLEWTQTGADEVAAKYLLVTPPAATTQQRIEFNELLDGGRLTVTALNDTPPGISYPDV
ncbi:DUF4232 domain-containing protein [Streptomyces sp. NPDC091376]|uniref:DUF4232 domain-containing protein n=1 Tax=Streptomyces sp. NPDC091376 TaxID=3365994 RepID=UPI0038029EE2